MPTIENCRRQTADYSLGPASVGYYHSFGDKRINSDQLQIPHPRFKERMSLQPIYEAAGDILLPDGASVNSDKKCAPDNG